MDDPSLLTCGACTKIQVSVVIPASTRREGLLHTLSVIHACTPAPDDVCVHVDGADPGILESIERFWPEVRIFSSPERLGPGGARHLLINAALHEIVVSFDDDSFPADPSFFSRVEWVFRFHPEATMLAAATSPAKGTPPSDCPIRVAEFEGCGCVYRKSAYQKLPGYVPRRVAYGMEELDLSLQLYQHGGIILYDSKLPVIHLSASPDRHSCQERAEMVVNAGLLPFLRYPCWLTPLMFWHVATRMRWEISWHARCGTSGHVAVALPPFCP
ncbi:glycosyltransferase family 2 protein [Verrucomicrobium spinosum]|uniref:glycosyltransferase family 2 protein n=1 Tax=Verrucomicrobium spinosum TaxID=2736 RepID=UPI0009463B2C|nr:glycosyltransferase family A protein [Verrucomicrobium spinosum]